MEKQNSKNISEKNTQVPELRCVRNTDKTYALYLRGGDGKMSPVPNIGPSIRPYEIMAEFPLRNTVAVKKYIRAEHGVQPTLHLVSLDNHHAPQKISDGARAILYDKQTRKFCITNEDDTTQYDFIMMIMRMLAQLGVATGAPNTTTSIMQILANAPGRRIRRARMRTSAGPRTKRRKRTRAFTKLKRARRTRKNTPTTTTGAVRPDIIMPYNLTPAPRIQYMPRAPRSDTHTAQIIAHKKMALTNAAIQHVR